MEWSVKYGSYVFNAKDIQEQHNNNFKGKPVQTSPAVIAKLDPFLKECCYFDKKAKPITTYDIYDKYVVFCSKRSIEPIGSANAFAIAFAKYAFRDEHVKGILWMQKRAERRRGGRANRPFYINLGIKDINSL